MRIQTHLTRFLPMVLLSVACGDKDGTTPDDSEPMDADGDGFEESVDCDDDDPAVFPGAAEVCDGVDNNCDASIDEGLTVSAWPDEDGDGYGASDGEEMTCPGVEGWVENFSDCDDGDADVRPDASEVCDEVDNDCNGLTDEGLTGEMYPDADGDGFGEDSPSQEVCLDASGWASVDGDCNDNDETIHPEAVEECDGLDNDCDGRVDLEDTSYEGSLECDPDDTGPTGDGFEGTEWFKYSIGMGFGDRNCELYWLTAGSPSSISACPDCEFVFDIDGFYDAGSSWDDGTCAKLAGDLSFTYGYIADYYGYGPYIMYYSSEYGSFSPWANASLSGSTLNYEYGYEDWDYYGNGTYYTYLWAGEAEIE